MVSADHLRYVLPPHLPAGGGHGGLEGVRPRQDGFEPHREKIPSGVVFDVKNASQLEQFGAHGIGAAHSRKAARLPHALDTQAHLGYQFRYPIRTAYSAYLACCSQVMS